MWLPYTFPNLAALLSRAFSEGWRRSYTLPDLAIRDFVRRNPLADSQAVVAEIDELLAMDLGPSHLRETLQRDFQCAYDPAVDGLTEPDWLRWVQRTLHREISAARLRREFSPGPGMRTLLFPEHRPLGWLERSDRNGAARAPAEGFAVSFRAWEYLAEARGAIRVPRDVPLALHIVGDGSSPASPIPARPPDQAVLPAPEQVLTALRHPPPAKADVDLSALGSCRPDDLFSIQLSRVNLTEPGVAPLQRLTDLRWLQLFRTPIVDADLLYISQLSHLEVLGIWHVRSITDAGLARLGGVTSLRYFAVGGPLITDAGLMNLRGCVQMEELYLEGTSVGERDLAWIRGMTTLRQLDLTRTNISDVGLLQLGNLPQLQQLRASSPYVTPSGLAALQRMLPSCRIIFFQTGPRT